jgi:hypothetical protein
MLTYELSESPDLAIPVVSQPAQESCVFGYLPGSTFAEFFFSAEVFRESLLDRIQPHFTCLGFSLDFFFFFITLAKVLKSPLGLELSDTKVYAP